MKKITFILIIAIILGACSNKTNKDESSNNDSTMVQNNYDKTTDSTQLTNNYLKEFYSNFEKKQLPFEFETEDNDETQNQKNIFNSYFNISFPTPNDFIFLKHLIQTDRIFDIIILSVGNNENYTNYFLLTIDKSKAEIIDTVCIGEDGYIDMGADWHSQISINKDLTVKSDKKTNSYKAITDLIVANNGYSDALYKEFKINNDGTIKHIISKNKKSYSLEIKLRGKDSVFIVSTMKDYKNIRSACDIANFCSNADKINKVFNSEAIKLEESSEVNKDSLYKYYPYITLNFDFKKYEYFTQFNYYPFYKKSQQTPENTDDLFFEAYKKIYDINNEQKRFEVSKNIFDGNKIQLGNNKFIEAFSEIKTQETKNNCFKALLKNLETDLVNMIDTCKLYSYSKDAVLTELSEITNQISLEKDKSTKLQNKISAITTLSNDKFNLK